MNAAFDSPCHVAMRTLPLSAGEPCGDAAAHWSLAADAHQPHELLLLVDGLGHGAPAAQAAQLALRLIDADPGAGLEALMQVLQSGLHDTRGAALGLALLQGQQLHYAGIGNTRALRWRGERLTRLSSQYGVVGHGPTQRLQVQQIDLLPGDWLLMFSDGVDEMLHLPPCLPEWKRDPALLCMHLLERWRSGADDAGVLVLYLERS